jgi:hypothetical protein
MGKRSKAATVEATNRIGNGRPAGPAAGHEAVDVTIPAPDIREGRITLVGDSPLICHAWSDKAKQMMLDKQMKKAKGAREAKSPEQDYLASLYPYPGGGYGFPLVAFKSAVVDACSYADGITKVQVRGAFHIIDTDHCKLARLDTPPRPREDMVRINGTTADVRHRGEFVEWEVQLAYRLNINVLSFEQLANLFQIAGFSVGVGEWRPQKDGSNGMFHVA